MGCSRRDVRQPEVQYQVDGQTKTRKVVDPHSFRILTNEAGEEQYHPVKFFTTGDERQA